jgi:hypothetical protein
MAKPADYKGERGINNGAEFLQEEGHRAHLPGGALVYPRPEFVQPDTGAHNAVGGGLGVHYNISGRPMKYGNFEKDLDGGLY